MKRLLVTGGRGFIGRHCLEPALAAGFDEVWATASVGGALLPEVAASTVHWRRIDLLAPGAVEALLDDCRPTHILHTAWETTHGSYWTSAANLRWLSMGTRLVEAFAAGGGERFVSLGTCAEYDWAHRYMVEAVTPERPSTFYGQIKLAHHHMLNAAAEQLGFSAATARVFFAYGPYENQNRIIPYACRNLAAGRFAEFGSGAGFRDFMHVEDVASGLVAMLTSDIRGACNVCSAAPTTLAEIVGTIARISGRPDLVKLGARPDRSGEPALLVGDNAELRSTGWKPRISLSEGLDRTYAWWRERDETRRLG